MLKLLIIIGSTRPGRIGDKVGKWFYEIAKKHPAFETELIDLAEVNLPLLDEPAHPSLHQYTKDHTKVWSERIARGDAYVFVTPEYNHGTSAALKNAIDYLNQEWRRKPAAFVSYGGISGGTRAVEQLRQNLSEVHMADIRDALHIPFLNSVLDEEGQIKDGRFYHTADTMLNDLAWWAKALKTAREQDSK